MRRRMYRWPVRTATQGKIGQLVPIFRTEVAPLDTWQGAIHMLVRMSPLKRALLADLFMDMFFFYVPHRQIWDEWEDFITGKASPAPTLPSSTVNQKFMFNYSSAGSPPARVNLFNRAYRHIWNEYFRDEDEAEVSIGAATANPLTVSHFNKNLYQIVRDEIQQGDASVAPLVVTNDTTPGFAGHITADSVSDALSVQRIKRRRELYGEDYFDFLRGLGVKTNYQMLDRPEVVARVLNAVHITDVVSTSTGTSLGSLAGHGITQQRTGVKKKMFPEHGTLIGLVVMRPTPIQPHNSQYMDHATDYQDFWLPEFERQPPQEIQRNHIANDGNSAVIGYVPKYEHYRRSVNFCHKDLRDFVPEYRPNQEPTTMDQIRNVNPDDYNTLFNDTTNDHYQIGAVLNMKTIRCVSRNQRTN